MQLLYLENVKTREFDTFPNEKQRISRMNAYIFLSNLLFLYIGFFGFLRYNGIEVKKLKVNTSKSKNAESFYIKQSYIDSNGKSTSRTIRKLGTLKELLVEHGPTRDDVMAWAKEQAALRPKSLNRKKRIIVFLLLSIQTERSPMEKSENFREVTFSCSLFIMNLV